MTTCHIYIRIALSIVALIVEASFDLIFYYKAKHSLFMYITLTFLNYITAAALTIYLLHDIIFDSQVTAPADEIPAPTPLLFDE